MALLGVLGLVPFFAPPLLRYDGFEPALSWTSLQAGYGAVILSFLGGVRAAQAVLTEDGDLRGLSLAMLPPLAGWVLAALAVFGQDRPHLAGAALLGLAGALVAQGLWDAKSSALPGWYRGLRIPLTALACLGLVIGAVMAEG